MTMLVLFGSVAACSAPEHAPNFSAPARSISTGGVSSESPVADEVSGSSGGASSVVPGQSAMGNTSGMPDTGSSAEFAVEELPDVACAKTSVPATLMMAQNDRGLTFNRAGIVGDRRYAFDSASLAFTTFDAQGGDSTEVVEGNLIALASKGEQLVALEGDSRGNLVLTSFDSKGVRQGASVTLSASGTRNHALGAGPDGTLAVWRRGQQLVGRAIPSGAAPSLEFDLGVLSCADPGCKPIISYYDHHFLIAWSHVQGDEMRLSWAVVALDGTVSGIRLAAISDRQYQLASGVSLADGSLALLLADETPGEPPLLVFVDKFGQIRSRGYRLLGIAEPLGIAASAQRLGVVAKSVREQAVLLDFSLEGSMQPSWTCIDDSDENTHFSPSAAIFSDAEGYGIVVRHIDGSAAYLQMGSAT